ncbi:hypothetical protein SEA_BUMBLE_65 [Arthrobacter phage Bumble]
MTAVVGPREKINGKWTAVVWCDTCEDGIRDARTRTLENWADSHNAARHRSEIDAILRGRAPVGGRT